MSQGHLDIILPSAADAEAIATILYRSSEAAYRDIVPPGFLWTHAETVASCEGLLSNPQAIVQVAASGDEWLGVSAVLVPDSPVGEAELRRLYVIPERWGAGIGNYLHDAALLSAQRAGAATASLWVLQNNNRARTFYENRGWRLAASEEDPERGVVEVRYERALGRAGVA